MGKKKSTSKKEVEKYHERTYFVLDKGEGDHLVEYVINIYTTESGTLVEMIAADNGSWSPSFVGTMVASVIDTGEGYKWNLLPIGKEHDYTDAHIMTILLAFLNSALNKPIQYEIVETRKIIGSEVR